MADWWEYLGQQDYYLRQRNRFERQARRTASDYLLRQTLEARGIMPDAFPSLGAGSVLTADRLPPEPAKKASMGVFGRIKDVVGDVTETVFRGPVDQPWDVLRPVIQALDWEQQHVGKPVVRAGAAWAGVPLKMARDEDVSLQEAFKTGWEQYEEQPGILREPLEIVASPTTWIPATWAIKGLKGAQLGFRLTLMEPLFGKTALKAMAGGAAEPKAMQQLIEQTRHLTGEDWALQGVQETLEQGRSKMSLTQQFRAHPGPLRGVLERFGIKLFDSDVSILAARWGEMNDFATSTSNASRAMMERTAQKGLRLSADGQGQLLDLPGQPYLRDVAAGFVTNPEKYPGLTKAQRGAIRLIAGPVEDVHAWEKAMGVRVAERPADVYFHLQAIEKPVVGGTVHVSQGIHAGKVLRIASEVDETTLLLHTPEGGEIRMLKDWVEPALEGVGLGPEVARYYGAKQAFRRPATYASQAEGAAAGVKYAPFFEAQRARIEQGYREVADAWLDAAISEVGMTATQLVPEAIRVARATAVGQYAWLRAVDRELQRNLRHAVRAGYKTPTLFEARAAARGVAGPMPPEVAALSGKLKQASFLPKQADRVEAYRAVAEEIKTAKAAAKAESATAKFRAAQFRAGLTAQAVGGPTEYPRFFKGRYYPEEYGAELQAQFRRPGFGAMENTINRFNQLTRPVIAAFDLSFLGIQGLIGLATNPVAYFQSLKNITFHGYVEILEQAARSGALPRFLRANGHIGSDVVGEFMVGRTLTKIPGIGQAFKFSNAWWTRFGNVLRLKMFEAAARPGMSRGVLKEIARNVSLATGYSAGKPHSIETAMLFAPKFFRSQIGLLADAATKGGVAGAQARFQIIALAAEGSVLTVSLNALQGKDTVLDPTDSNFMRVRVFGRDISVFGPWDTLMRAVSITATQGPVEGANYLRRSKASPAMARVYDIIEGETFRGQKIDWSNPLTAMESIAALGSQLLPISVQQSLVEQGVPRTPGAVAGAFVEFLGTKATPLTEWEKLGIVRDDIALREHNKKWDELEPAQHYDLSQRFEAELKRPEATTDVGKALEQRRAVGARFQTDLEELEKAVQTKQLSLPEWREQYIERRRLQAGEYQQWEASLSEEVRSELDKPSDDPGLQALSGLSTAFRESRTPWGTIDPEELDAALSKAEAGWTSEQEAFVDRNTGYRATPTLTRYRAAQKVLRPYWEVREEVWAEFQERRPDLAKYADADEYGFALVNQLISMGVPEDQAVQQMGASGLLKAVERVVDARRRALRRKSRELDKLLFEFYGYTPLYLQARRGSAQGEWWRRLGA